MNRKLLHWTRTVHVYLTMAALGLMLFFAVTGITANHEEWFGATARHERTVTGQTPADAVERVDKLRIVEHLRAQFKAAGAVADFAEEPERLSVVFKAPGYMAEATIQRQPPPPDNAPENAPPRPAGYTEIKFTTFNLVARLNDLHRARDTGDTWRILVDVSGAVIILACVTGVMLWLVLPKRRRLGIAYGAIGLAAAVAFYLLVVP